VPVLERCIASKYEEYSLFNNSAAALILCMTAKPNLSIALWIPCAWFFLASSRNLSRWLHPYDESFPLDGSPADQVILGLFICIGVAILITRRINWQELINGNKWILVLFCYMALSVIWSNFPEISARRWIRSAGTLIMVLIVLTEADPLEGISALLRRCYYLHLPLSIIAIKYFRAFGVYYSYDGSQEEWQGIALQRNGLGQVAMCSGIYFIWHILNEKGRQRIWSDLAFLLMALWLLRGSGTQSSKTAIIGFVIGVCILFGLKYLSMNLKYIRKYIAILFSVSICVIGLAQLWLMTFEDSSLDTFIIELSGREKNLTGRAELWDDLFKIASEHPIIGVGYGALWVGEKGKDLYPLPSWSEITPSWRPKTGHSGYVDAYVELGLLGIILIMGTVIATCKSISRMVESDYEYASARVAFLVPILINNYTESSLLNGTQSLWFLFLLVAINITRTQKTS
jgi:exopolysaccharide production protein ExoQ